VTGPTALVAGATGLVGGELLRQLTSGGRYRSVTALVRRQVPLPEGVTGRSVTFDHLEDAGDALRADHVFCALGTTIRTAGSQEAFRRVDVEYVVALAEATRGLGASHFLLVSSIGAAPTARAFYLRVKGEVERAVQAVGFPALTIVRPSLLLGDRGEFRLGETLAKPFGFLMPRRWRPVHARTVAATMIRAAGESRAGTRIIESGEIVG